MFTAVVWKDTTVRAKHAIIYCVRGIKEGQYVKFTISGAASDKNVIKMTFMFEWL